MPEHRAVLFDLDGTLADTAPDLAATANRMRTMRNLPPLPLIHLRPVASQGARGLLRVAFGLQPEDTAFASMRAEFLNTYQNHLCEETTLFPGLKAVLDRLDTQNIAWGIVTNKPEFLTLPLVTALRLAPGVVVSGDSTPRAKPDPLPVLSALQQLGVEPKNSLMIGDDLRDIQAGRAAGTHCWAAAWGYIEAGNSPETWGADQIIPHSAALELALLHFHAAQ